MFISKAEKENLLFAIKSLESRIHALENPPVKMVPEKPKRPMSEEHKAKIGAANRAHFAAKKAARELAVGGTA